MSVLHHPESAIAFWQKAQRVLSELSSSPSTENTLHFSLPIQKCRRPPGKILNRFANKSGIFALAWSWCWHSSKPPLSNVPKQWSEAKQPWKSAVRTQFAWFQSSWFNSSPFPETKLSFSLPFKCVLWDRGLHSSVCPLSSEFHTW